MVGKKKWIFCNPPHTPLIFGQKGGFMGWCGLPWIWAFFSKLSHTPFLDFTHLSGGTTVLRFFILAGRHGTFCEHLHFEILGIKQASFPPHFLLSVFFLKVVFAFSSSQQFSQKNRKAYFLVGKKLGTFTNFQTFSVFLFMWKWNSNFAKWVGQFWKKCPYE